jgi:hypothetical protein
MPLIDESGTRKKPSLGLGLSGSFKGAPPDEDERQIAALRDAATSTQSSATAKTSVPTDILKKPDETTKLLQSIEKVGGPKVYSQRVNFLSRILSQKYGVKPDPAVVLDMARVPLPLADIKKGIIYGISGYHRGLANIMQQEEAARWSESEMMVAGEPKGSRAEAIQSEARQRLADQLDVDPQAITLPSVVLKNEPPADKRPFANPYWDAYYAQVKERKAKQQETPGWTAPEIPGVRAGEPLFTEVSPLVNVGSMFGIDPRIGFTETGPRRVADDLPVLTPVQRQTSGAGGGGFRAGGGTDVDTGWTMPETIARAESATATSKLMPQLGALPSGEFEGGAGGGGIVAGSEGETPTRSSYDTVVNETFAKEHNLDYVEVAGGQVQVRSSDVASLSKAAASASVAAAIVAATPAIVKAGNVVVEKTLSGINWFDQQKDFLGWYTHARMEYMLAGQPVTATVTQQTVRGIGGKGYGGRSRKQTSGGGYEVVGDESGTKYKIEDQGLDLSNALVRAYNPDGSELYLTITAGMTDEQFRKVLDIQGTTYSVNEDGSLTISSMGEDKGSILKAAFNTDSAKYADWLANQKLSLGETFITGGLTDLGYIPPMQEGDTFWDARRLVGFMGDMFFYGIGDAALGSGIRLAASAKYGVNAASTAAEIAAAPSLQRLSRQVVLKTPWVKTIAERVAEETSPTRIMALTGIKDPQVAVKWAGISNLDELTKDWTQTLQEGFRLDPGDIMVKNQLKLALNNSDSFQNLPNIMKQAFKVGAERSDQLPIADWDVYDTVRHVADAFNADTRKYVAWSDRILSTSDRFERVGLMKQMWDDFAQFDPKTYDRAVVRMSKYQKSHGLESSQVFGADPYTGAEMSVRNTASELERLNAHMATVDTKLDGLAQMELEKLPGEATLETAEKAGARSNVEATIAQYRIEVDGMGKYIAGEESDLARAVEPTAKQIKEEAKRLRDADIVPGKQIEVLKALHDLGGFSWRLSDVDHALPRGSVLAITHGWANGSSLGLLNEVPRLFNSAGKTLMGDAGSMGVKGLDGLASEFANTYPDLARFAGVDGSADSLYEYLKSIAGKTKATRPIKEYAAEAEKNLYRGQADEFGDIAQRQTDLDALKAEKLERERLIDAYEKAVASGDKGYQPFALPAEAPGRLAASQRAQLTDSLTAKKIGLQAQIDDLLAAGDKSVPVPLLPSQMVQYFRPPVPLDMLTAEYSGVVGRALDSIQRGLVVKAGKGGKVAAASVGGVPAAGAAAMIATESDASSEQTWIAALSALVGGGAIGYRLGMRYAKNMADPAQWMKVTPNLDYLTSMWKRYALGSVGVLFRIAGDEPARMASRGYGWDAPMAWFKNPQIQKDMMKEGWYLGPYSYEKGMTQMAYLFNNRIPDSFVVFNPTSPGWLKAFPTATKILQGQQHTKFWVDAINAGEDGKIGLARWAQAHPDTAKQVIASRGTTLETWIEQNDEFLAKYTHRPVTVNGSPIGSLSDAQKAEWTAYKEGGTVPAWFNPKIDLVITDSAGSGLMHVRRNRSLYGFLSGQVPMTQKAVRDLPISQRPFISARREKGALFSADGVTHERNAAENVFNWGYDIMYGSFDNIMKNTRSSIYMREYKREVEGISRTVAERNAAGAGIAVDHDLVHRMADRKAQSMVDFMTYSGTRTGLENLLRDVLPFLPATRDFLTFWAAEGMRRPTRLAAYLRLSTELPEEVQVQWDEDSMFGLGRLLEAFTGSNQLSFNPRALSFFTGGATMPGVEGDSAMWNLVEQQFPGFGPFVTVPAHYLAADHPDQFGLFPSFWGMENSDLTKIPGMDLVQKNIPLFSRAERFVWATVATIGTALKALKISDTPGYDLAQGLLGDIPWLGRDKEARDRMVDLALRWVMAEEGMSGRDIGSLTDEERETLLTKAKNRIVEREAATGFLGFVTPAIPYFQEREEQDLQTALGAYKDTYNSWVTPTDNEEGTLHAGWQVGARAKAQTEQTSLRKKYGEYEMFFDYIDGLALADEEKVLEVGTAHPEVISYFVSIYNNHGDAADYVGLENYDTSDFGSWAAARAVGLKPVKDPNALMDEVANKLADAKEFNESSASWAEFEKIMQAMGYQKGDEEYETQRKAFRDKLALGARRSDPTTPYYKLGWLTPAEQGAEPNPSTVAWNEQQTEMLRAEYEDAISQYAKNNPARDMLKAEFTDRFIEEGLDPKALTASTTDHLPAAQRRQAELMADITKEPYGFTKEEFISHNLPYNASLKTNMAQAVDARTEVMQIVADNGGDIWDKKYDGMRASYQEYIRNLCDGNSAFAAFWDYYQSPKWERMQETGRYTSETWQDWFDALATRDQIVDSAGGSGILSMSDPAKKWQGLVVSLWEYAGKLKDKDPTFAAEFEYITASFWNKTRVW